MADQAQINNKSYFGFQSGLGIAGTADKQFPDISIVPSPSGPTRPIHTVGEEYPSAFQHGIIESDIAVTGDCFDFVGFCYPLEAMFGTVSPSTIGGTGKRRLYTPSTASPRYFTNDFGSSVRFQRAIDCFLHSLHMHATLNETVFDGAGKGQMIVDSGLSSLSLAGSPTLVAQKTPDPLNSDLYVATSLSGLDTAVPLSRNFVFDLNVTDRWSTIHAMNSLLAGSYDGVVRKRPGTAEGMIQLGSDDDGWAWLTRVLNNTVAYIRYRIFGDQIAAGTAEVQTVDLSGDDDPTGGTWTLTILGKTLTGLAWNIAAAALQASINALQVRGASSITVSKVGFVYTITFPATLGNVQAVTTDNGVGFTGGGGDTFAITVLTTTPGVDPIWYMIQVDAAVVPSGWPKRSEMEGLDTLDIPLGLMKTSTLNGYQIIVVNETATL